jgi:hypothetical protein
MRQRAVSSVPNSPLGVQLNPIIRQHSTGLATPALRRTPRPLAEVRWVKGNHIADRQQGARQLAGRRSGSASSAG